jgi:hypothetical protein
VTLTKIRRKGGSMKKRSWLVVGGVAILVAVAAIAYHMGKRARLSDIDVVVTVEEPQSQMPKTQSSYPTQTYSYQQPQTTRTNRCPTCGGRGYLINDNGPPICRHCGGAGKVIIVRVTGYIGNIPVYQRDNAPSTCPACEGYGVSLDSYSPCPTCGGKVTEDWAEYWKQQARQIWAIWRQYFGYYFEYYPGQDLYYK